jgi:hypothetical protein
MTTVKSNHDHPNETGHWSPDRKALDALTIQTIGELWAFGINMPQIQKMLGLDCPKRLGAIVRSVRLNLDVIPVPDAVRYVRPVTSLDWFIAQPQRLLRSYVAIRVYQVAKESVRSSGVVQKQGLMKARLIIETFRNYLDLFHLEPATSDFSLPRIGNLIDFYERGALVLRPCRRCQREHLTDGNHIHSGMCPSCTRVNLSFCACGRSVDRSDLGRRPGTRVRCLICAGKDK